MSDKANIPDTIDTIDAVEELTQDAVNSQLDYNPLTGDFKWKASRRGVRKGRKAGYLGSQGYPIIKVYGKQRYAHRLAMISQGVDIAGMQIDHINQDKTDNRLANLRVVTHAENSKNRALTHDSPTGILGVRWGNHIDKWIACIGVNYKRKHLGCFGDFFEACCARKSAENKHGYHRNHGAS